MLKPRLTMRRLITGLVVLGCAAAAAVRPADAAPPEKGEVVIVRSGRGVRIRAEALLARTRFERMKALLDDAGIRYRVLADEQISDAALAGTRLVIMPDNHAPTPIESEALAKYAGGGKGKLMNLQGGPKTQWAVGPIQLAVREAWRPGEFHWISFTDDAPHSPPQVVNDVSAIRIMDTTDADTRVLAYWKDSAGKLSRYPAVIETPRGLYFTQALAAGDEAAKAAMLLRLVTHLWGPAARQGTENLLGRIILKQSDLPHWKKAAALVARSRELLKSDTIEANDVARRAMAAYDMATAADMPSRGNELRYAWIANPLAIDPGPWDDLARRLAEANFTGLVVNLCSPAFAAYPSKVLPAHQKVARRGDQLKAALAAARRHGLQLHLWRTCWHAVGDDGSQARLLAATWLSQADHQGRSLGWACPSRGDTIDREVKAIEEIVTYYAVDGVVLDEMAFAGPEACYCRQCRAATELLLGKEVPQWPADVRRPGAMRKGWLAMRRQVLANAVRRISQKARQVRPGVVVSVAVGPDRAAALDRTGQDWPQWVKAGYVEMVFLKNFGLGDRRLSALLADQVSGVSAIGKPVKLIVGLGPPAEAVGLDWQALAGQLTAARRDGLRGYALSPLADRSGRLLRLL
ncbi:MAG: family 10 glycosylhydrolase, partial [Anaerolineaceae bacterium]|nr:family 10 glycosylhydrolase [Anaerolineaceae bacterium]